MLPDIQIRSRFEFPRGINCPLILIFSVVGTQAVSNYVDDLWIMIGFGVLGCQMTKYGIVPAGVLRGIVLGPIA